MPRFEGFRVLRHQVTVLVHRHLGQSLVQLDKGVMIVGHHSDRKSLEIPDVLVEDFVGVLPEGVVVVAEEPVLNHLFFVILHEELLDFVRVAHL